MTPERAMEIARSITESIYKEEIAQAILAACEAESNMALEPSPCGVAGHRRVDWGDCPACGGRGYTNALCVETCKTCNPPGRDGGKDCLACQREEAVASAMAEKCAKVIDKTFGLPNSLGDKLRSFSPADVLEAHDQAVRLEGVIEGMLQIHNRALHEYGDESTPDCEACSWIQTAKMRLAALRATPQQTAVKEPNNG